MKKIKLYIIALLSIAAYACNSKQESKQATIQPSEAVLISNNGADASCPYLTNDPLGNPVLCWTEEQEESFVLKLATFEKEEGKFSKPITVTPSLGTRIHAESMNKVAFKADGTIVAVYATKSVHKDNRHAGFLWYTLSTDKGKSWSSPHYLHSDTLPMHSRSFFDIATLPDGEVGAVWLDGRFRKEGKGSSLFFAKTENGKGFGPDKQIGAGTCECCRTALFVSETNQIHVAYRDIIDDSIRDIVQQVSSDNGSTFSAPKRISVDNWEINACPHSGPSLAQNKAGLQAVWFTAGGGPGVYLATSPDNGQSFNRREKLSATARHPQLTTLSNGKLAIAWEEPKHTVIQSALLNDADQDHQGIHQNSSAGSGIVLQIRDSNAALFTDKVTDEQVNATYPVLAAVKNDQVLLAWVQETAGESSVYYKVSKTSR